MPERIRMTKTKLLSLQPNASGDRMIYDTEVKTLCVRIKPTGAKGYCIQYRNADRQSKRLTIGNCETMTPDQARRIAKEKLVAVDQGKDPVAQRDERRSMMTMTQFCDSYMERHALKKKKESSAKEDRRYIDRNILPKLGKKKVRDITRKDVEELHQSMADSPYAANRALSLLSKMMNLAEAWGERDDNTNPCRHVQKFKEKGKERYLTNAELANLGQALQEFETSAPIAVDAIRLLLLTGARKNEILTLRWENVDCEAKTIFLEDTKTGARTIHIGDTALTVLRQAQARTDSPYVIPGRYPSTHMKELRKAWKRISERAGFNDVRIHDLRHTNASIAVGAGMSLPMVGKLLGHTQAQTTQRYAHLADDPVKNASIVVGGHIGSALAGQRYP